MSAPLLPRGASTGLGSLPGTDPAAAVRQALEQALPHLPELPARGPHADLVGRGAALLVDLPTDLQPSGWRLVERSSRDGVRARDLLARDLDALEDAVGDSPPERLKVQAVGPWTLVATLELQRGERVLSDPGAVRDVQASLAEGLSRHVAELSRRLPGTRLLVQLDEPALGAVLRGTVPTPSGFGRYRVPEASHVRDTLAGVLSAVTAAGAGTVVHSCDERVPLRLLQAAGPGAVAIDLLLPQREDELGALIEAGTGLLAGCAPTTGTRPPSTDEVLRPLRGLWRRLGLDPALLPGVVLTPGCGLAGATAGYARAVTERLGEAARALEEEPL